MTWDDLTKACENLGYTPYQVMAMIQSSERSKMYSKLESLEECSVVNLTTF